MFCPLTLQIKEYLRYQSNLFATFYNMCNRCLNSLQDAPISTRVRKTDPQQQQQAAQKKTGKAALLEWLGNVVMRTDIYVYMSIFADSIAVNSFVITLKVTSDD
jgi:hypothetical protein